jgi:hypothetical protein
MFAIKLKFSGLIAFNQENLHANSEYFPGATNEIKHATHSCEHNIKMILRYIGESAFPTGV